MENDLPRLSSAITRSIQFFSIEADLLPLFECAGETFEKVMNKIFNKPIAYKIKGDLIVEILDCDNCLFGSIGKLKNIKSNPLQRARDTETLEKASLDLPNNTKLEEFTYFYIDYRLKRALVLRNDDAPSFTKTMKLLFTSNSEMLANFQYFNVYPEVVKNITSTLNRFTALSKIECIYKSPASQENGYMPSINSIFNKYENQLNRVAIELHFKNDIPNAKTIRDLQAAMNTDGMESFKVSGKIEDRECIQDTIDLIKKIITKKVIISLPDNDILKYEDKVKNILKEQLLTDIK